MRRSAAIVVACGLFATSCATGGSTSADGVASGDGPGWYAEGVASGRRAVASEDALQRANLPDLPGGVSASSLPPRSKFVSALASAGLGEASAGCLYDNLTTGEVVDDANAIFSLLTAGSSPTSALSALGALKDMDAGTSKRLVVALSPCLDTATLLGLLANTGAVDPSQLLQGLGGAGAAAAWPALLAALPSSGLGATGIDPSLLASLSGGQLPPQQLEALKGLIAAAVANAAGGGLPGAGGPGKVDLSTLDLSKLDLAKMTSEQVVALLASIAQGLTPAQQQQLGTLANVDLQRLHLDIDPAKLTKEQIGALLVLVLPYLSASLTPPDGKPPAGQDPGQIYIPPDMDLSHINPLYFVPRENVILGLSREGVAPAVAGCLYDKLRLIDPQLIGRAFTGDDITAAGQVLLSVLSCVI